MASVPKDLQDITVASWTVRDVSNWLELHGFSEEVRSVFSLQEIDGYTLLRITEKDLRKFPLLLPKIGTIKHLFGDISDLKSTTIAKVDITQPGMPVLEEEATRKFSVSTRAGSVVHVTQLGVSSDGGCATDTESDTEEVEDPSTSESPPATVKLSSQHRRLPPLKPEVGKAVLAFGYVEKVGDFGM